jgi:nicotinic acid mononucleotide adenylyltransferase
VLPSAFNPPTRAHLGLLRAGAGATGATPAALLTTRNVAKGIEGAPLSHRVAMLLATHDEIPGLEVLVANAARFVDQARALRAAFPGRAIDFVAGYDTLVRIFDGRYYEDMEADLDEFFAHHRLVAANRGEQDLEAILRFLGQVSPGHASRVIPVEIPDDEAVLSSTLARTRPDERQRIVPAAVAAHIERFGLYDTGPASK